MGASSICRNCQTAIELEQTQISQAIVESASAVGFNVEGQTVEIVGLCGACAPGQREA